MATTYYLTTTDSGIDFALGENWANLLSVFTPANGTLLSTIPNEAIQFDLSVTPDGNPGVLGGSGSQSFTVSVVIQSGNSNVTLEIFLSRLGWLGGIWQALAGPLSLGSPQTATAGTKTFGPTSVDLGQFAGGDRLIVRFRWVNSSMGGAAEQIVQTIGAAGTTVTAPWTPAPVMVNQDTDGVRVSTEQWLVPDDTGLTAQEFFDWKNAQHEAEGWVISNETATTFTATKTYTEGPITTKQRDFTYWG